MTQRLTLLTWPDYVNPLTIEEFEQEFDITIRLEIVPSAVELIERMQTENPGVDLLVPPDYAVRELSAHGSLATLDHCLLPNLEHLDRVFGADALTIQKRG